MPNITLSHAIRRALFTATLIGAAPMVATAQDAPTTLDRVEVTGSNIHRTDIETASPVQVVTRQEIERTGKTTIAEYLQTLTADGSGSIPKSFGSGFAGGGSGVSLRGLGAGSTLVLMNGRRMAPFGLADDGQKVFTDLSTIPMEAVERVEVLKDGASAIYGSDAIAGVVNIILRKDFKGAVVKGSFGGSGDGDGYARKGSLTAGFGDLNEDRYNIFFNIEASKTDEILMSDRRDRRWIGTGDIRPWGYGVSGSQFLFGGITGAEAVGSGVGSVLNPATGRYESLPGCAQMSHVLPPDPGGGCLWESGQFQSLTPREKYINFFTRGTFALSDNFEAYVEAGYSNKKTQFHRTPSQVSGAWGYPGGPVNANSGPGAVMLGANHPDNPFGVDVPLRYAAFDVGPRTIDTKNDYYRFLAGVKGTLGAWDVDVGVLHSETELRNQRRGFLRYSAVRSALTDPNSPFGYWRIGDNANLNSQALYDFIAPTIYADASTSLDLVDFKGSRTLMDLPGGSMGLALGAEWRRQKAKLDPQSYTDLGDIIGLGYSAYDGTQEVAAAYAELLAPVTKTLELSGAVRVDSYKHGDTATTPKLGIKWSPIEQLAIRGTYAEGFRAPNPAESGKGGSAGFTRVRDPVRCPGGTPVPGANQGDCSVPIAVITSPNPDLKPEKSKSYTLGFVVEPTSSTTLTVDAWQIKRSDEINSEQTATAVAQGRVVRGNDLINGQPGTGTLLATSARYINSAATTVRGVDVDVRQRFELGAYGKLLLDLQWTHLDKFEREDVGGDRTEFAGTHGNCDVTNCIGTPKDRINFGITWDRDVWSVSGVVNYIGSFKNTAFEGDTCASSFADGSDAPRGCRIPKFYTFDLSGRWKPTESMEVFGSVQNLFDKIAPLDPLTYGANNYNPLHVSGAIGRYFTVGVKYTFD